MGARLRHPSQAGTRVATPIATLIGPKGQRIDVFAKRGEPAQSAVNRVGARHPGYHVTGDAPPPGAPSNELSYLRESLTGTELAAIVGGLAAGFLLILAAARSLLGPRK